MHYRLSLLFLLLLFALLPAINLPAAPAPDPWAILDIGPPPKGKTAEQHLKFHIEFNTALEILNTVISYPEVKKLPSVTALKDVRPWLAKNLRVKAEKGDRLLRFTFRAGKRIEQVTIINAFLRANLHWHDLDGGTLKRAEEGIRRAEDRILDLEQRIESGLQPHMVNTYREGINWLRNTSIPELRAGLANWKQYAVIRWAR